MHKTLIRLSIFSAISTLAAMPVFADEANLLEEGRSIAVKMPPKLLDVLNDEIKKGGHAEAMVVCREKAPQMAKNLSEQTGWAIRRVSLKNRNPKAVPDSWEQAVLEDFDRRTATGEKPTALEKGEVVSEGDKKYYRYMKALPTQDLCLNCHGTPDRIEPAVKAKLNELYPGDKAVG
ncbi:MAG: DUF3365 domain-containing protein [Prosthecobacter sp.]|nr:DUF3365 domain-containing protein [Prosthecobacter sp.]